MPGRDRTGPVERKSRGREQGRGNALRGRRQWIHGRETNTGECVCPDCGVSAVHQSGIPCSETVCPNCGQSMIRQ